MLCAVARVAARRAGPPAFRHVAVVSNVPTAVSAIISVPARKSSSTTVEGTGVGELPPLVAKAQADVEEDPDYNTMKDGLAIKQATATFAGRRRCGSWCRCRQTLVGWRVIDAVYMWVACGRFYKQVNIRETRAVNGAVQYEILLDGHSLKTPGTERPYRIPSKGLALAIALEWDQQVRQVETRNVLHRAVQQYAYYAHFRFSSQRRRSPTRASSLCTCL